VLLRSLLYLPQAMDGIDQNLLEVLLENAHQVHPNQEDAPMTSPFTWGRPVIWLGGRKVAESAEMLRILRATHIINCAAGQVSAPLLDSPDVQYCMLPLEDAPAINASGDDILFDLAAPAHFNTAIKFLDVAMSSSQAVVYVHCAGGVSRSCCVVLAYLVAKCGMRLSCLRASERSS